jgi:prophage regulatory protein
MTRIIRKKELLKMVPFSATHIARLEAEGRFPRRIRFSGTRVGWIESEVEDWIEMWKETRSVPPRSQTAAR